GQGEIFAIAIAIRGDGPVLVGAIMRGIVLGFDRGIQVAIDAGHQVKALRREWSDCGGFSRQFALIRISQAEADKAPGNRRRHMTVRQRSCVRKIRLVLRNEGAGGGDCSAARECGRCGKKRKSENSSHGPLLRWRSTLNFMTLKSI